MPVNIIKFLIVFALSTSLMGCSVLIGVADRQIENVKETWADIKIYHAEQVVMTKEKNASELSWWKSH